MYRFLIVALILLGATEFVTAQQRSQTLLIDYIAELIVQRVDASSNYHIQLQPSNQFALLELQSKLKESGVENISASEQYADQLVTITIDADNILFKKSTDHYQRKLQAAITIQLIKLENDRILDSVTREFLHEDTLRTKNPELLSSGWHPARFHDTVDTSTRSRWKRYLEPVVITGAVATTVYLIYNVRSQ